MSRRRARKKRPTTYRTPPGLLTPAEMYRAACAPQPLPTNLVNSAVRYILWLERGHETYSPVTDNWYSPDWGAALRGALGEASMMLAESGYEPTEVLDKSDPQYDTKVWSQTYFMASQHEKKYCANTLIRRVVQALCRNAVPIEERIL